MENKYDSTNDTLDHISKVRELLREVDANIMARAHIHDESKLQEPEKSMYDEFTPKLRGLTYGSDEYKATLKEMGVALQHHYSRNRHHPEHYENGVDGMDLFDVIEMLVDWKAASLRHSDGTIVDSLAINRQRFDLSDQLYEILKNTVINMEW